MAFPCRLAVFLGCLARCTANCAPGQCVERNGYLYRTLDGTRSDDMATDCQRVYLPMLNGWELSGYSADSRHVASMHSWGTAAMFHSTTPGECSWTTLFSGGSCNDWRVLVSGATYKPMVCHGRILIVRATTTTTTTFTTTLVTTTTTVTCAADSERNAQAGCSPCPAGHAADAGINTCLPTAEFVAGALDTPTITLDVDIYGTVRGVVQVKSLEATPPLHKAVALQYSIDVATDPSALSMQSACNGRWAEESSGRFQAVLPYSSLDQDCPLSASVEGGEVLRRGTFAVLIGYTPAGGESPTPIKRWLFPQRLRFPTLVHAVHRHLLVSEDTVLAEADVQGSPFGATVTLYDSDALTTVKLVPAYYKNDVVYAAISLVGQLNSYLELRIQSALLSKSEDPTVPALLDVTSSLATIGSMTPEGQGFSVTVGETCTGCFIHIQAELALRSGGARRLHALPFAHAFTAISVKEALVAAGTLDLSSALAGGAMTVGVGVGLPLWQVVLVQTAVVVFGFIIAAKMATRMLRGWWGRKSSYRTVPKSEVASGGLHSDVGVSGQPGGDIEGGVDLPPRPTPALDEEPALGPVSHETAEVFKHMLSRSFDLKHGTGSHHKSIEYVGAWHVAVPYIDEYETRKRRVRFEVARVLQASRDHVAEVTTLLPDLQTTWGLDTKCNETWLLHGTSCNKVLEILSAGVSEGFSGGLFGRGAYLAEDVANADQYAEPLTPKGDGPGEAELLKALFTDFGKDAPKEDIFFFVVCSVVLGCPAYTKDAETAMFSPSSCLAPGSSVFESAEKRELAKVPGVSPTVRYHSLIAETGGFREFVIFNGNGILPQYIVAYRRAS